MDAFYGELRLFPFMFTPQYWLPCDGRKLQIQEYQPLYAVIGNTFGGDLKTYFNLPDLRARVAVGAGDDPFDSFDPTFARTGGVNQVVLTTTNMPSHTHTLNGASVPVAGRVATPAGNLFCQMTYKSTGGTTTSSLTYIPDANNSVTLGSGTLAPFPGTGGGHENRQPYLAMGWFICVLGAEFPIRP